MEEEKGGENTPKSWSSPNRLHLLEVLLAPSGMDCFPKNSVRLYQRSTLVIQFSTIPSSSESKFKLQVSPGLDKLFP